MRTLQSGDGVEKPLSPQCSIRIARLMDGSSVPISTPPTRWADSKAGVVWIRLGQWENAPHSPCSHRMEQTFGDAGSTSAHLVTGIPLGTISVSHLLLIHDSQPHLF